MHELIGPSCKLTIFTISDGTALPEHGEGYRVPQPTKGHLKSALGFAALLTLRLLPEHSGRPILTIHLPTPPFKTKGDIAELVNYLCQFVRLHEAPDHKQIINFVVPPELTETLHERLHYVITRVLV